MAAGVRNKKDAIKLVARHAAASIETPGLEELVSELGLSPKAMTPAEDNRVAEAVEYVAVRLRRL